MTTTERYSPEAAAGALSSAMKRLITGGLTTASGGNVSLRDSSGQVWLTPTGVDKAALKPDDMVCCAPGRAPAGRYQPSIEAGFHQALYEVLPEAGAVVHAHSPFLMAFAASGKCPELSLQPKALGPCGEPRLVPFALPGSVALAASVRRAVSSGAHCLILDRHAALTWGASLPEALFRFETFERAAEAELLARSLTQVLSPRPAWAGGLSTVSLSEESRRWKERAVATGLFRPHEGFWLENPFQVADGPLPSGLGQALKNAFDDDPKMSVAALIDPPILAALDLCGRAPNGALLTESFFFLRDIGASCPPSARCPLSWWPGQGLLVIAETAELLYHRLEVAVVSAKSQWAAASLGGVPGLNEDMQRNMNQDFFRS